jgi:ATP adenylyltransferase
MWSPWRANYITSFKDESEDKKCIFCQAIEDEDSKNKSLVLFKGKYCYVMLNLYPYNSGHLMIIPYRHVSDYLDLSEEELQEVNFLHKVTLKSIREEMKPHGFNFGTNIGRTAGAGIDTHLHFHIVPRWNGDTNFMPALGEVKVISEDLLQTRDKLKPLFEKYSNQK